jgi:ubiquinone/menaquinone biosynthesis C-methylase UbiE
MNVVERYNHFQSEYSAQLKTYSLLEKYKEVFMFIKAKIKGYPLVDLAGGQGKFMENFSLENGVTHYYNVDIAPHLKEKKVTKVTYVNESIMEFLAQNLVRLKEISPNFCINGFGCARRGDPPPHCR